MAEALIAKGNPALREREALARSEGENQAKSEGEAQGRAEAIVRVLEARGMAVGPAQQEQIRSCRDLARLDRWLSRAVSAGSAADVLSEP